MEAAQSEFRTFEDLETYQKARSFRKAMYGVLKLLNGYLRYLRDRKVGSSLSLHESPAPYGEGDEDLEAWLATLPI